MPPHACTHTYTHTRAAASAQSWVAHCWLHIALRGHPATAAPRVTHGHMCLPTGSGKLPTLAVESVQNASVGCPGGATVPAAGDLDCTSGEDQPYIAAHGTLMMLGWGIMLPTGVISARFLKHRPNALWFKMHRGLQISGLCIALIGWIIAMARFDVFSAGPKKNTSFIHGTLGMVRRLRVTSQLPFAPTHSRCALPYSNLAAMQQGCSQLI